MFLAGVPFLLLLAGVLGYVLGGEVEATTVLVQGVLDRLLPPQFDVGGSMLDPLMEDVVRTRAAFGIGGAVGFLWFSARLFGSLRSVMGFVMDHGRDRGYWRGMLWDVHLTFVTMFLMTVWVVVTSFLTVSSGSVGSALIEMGLRRDVLGGLELLFGRLLAVAVVMAIFVSLYRWLPKQRTEWIPAIAGGVGAGLLFELARWLFGILIRAFPPMSIYTGTLGALVVVVFWTYYAALIFVMGAEVASATREHLATPVSP